MGLFGIDLFFVVYGILYILFAFREPPALVRNLFKVPSIFIFLPEQHVVRWGRIAIGTLFLLVPVATLIRFLVTGRTW